MQTITSKLLATKGKKEESREAIFEKLMTKNFSDLIKDMSLHIEKSQ